MSPKKSYEGTCERCDEFRLGSKKLMLYRWIETFLRPPIVYEFYWRRCQRIMKIYSIIGFLLLGSILAAGIGVFIWLRMTGP